MITAKSKNELRRILEKIWIVVNGCDYDPKTLKRVCKIVGNEIRRQYEREQREKAQVHTQAQ